MTGAGCVRPSEVGWLFIIQGAGDALASSPGASAPEACGRGRAGLLPTAGTAGCGGCSRARRQALRAAGQLGVRGHPCGGGGSSDPAQPKENMDFSCEYRPRLLGFHSPKASPLGGVSPGSALAAAAPAGLAQHHGDLGGQQLPRGGQGAAPAKAGPPRPWGDSPASPSSSRGSEGEGCGEGRPEPPPASVLPPPGQILVFLSTLFPWQHPSPSFFPEFPHQSLPESSQT